MILRKKDKPFAARNQIRMIQEVLEEEELVEFVGFSTCKLCVCYSPLIS